MACWTTHPPSTSAAPRSPPNRRPWVHPPAVQGPAHRRPPILGPGRLRAGRHAWAARPADLRSHRRRHRKPRRRTRSPDAARLRQRHQGGPDPAAASGRAGHRPCRRSGPRTHGPVTCWLTKFAPNSHACSTARLVKVLATEPARESEVVADEGADAGLSAEYLRLQHDCLEPFGRGVGGGRQAG
jgi:hypothetical protein